MMLRRALLALAFFAGAVPADAATVNLGSPYRDTSTGAIYLRGAPSPYVLSLPALCATNQFSTGGSTSTGLPVCAQPSFSNLTGQASAAQIAAGAAASNVGTLGGALAGSTLPNPAIANAYVTGGMLASGAAATNLGAGLGTSGAAICLLNSNCSVSGSWAFSGSTYTFNNPTSMTFNGGANHNGVENFNSTTNVPTAAVNDNSALAVSTQHVYRDYAALGRANTFTNKQTLPAATASLAPLNLPHGTAPTSPVNGDIWTTTAGLYARVNGTTIGPYIATTGSAQRVLLNTLTASNSTSIQDTTSISASYTEYEVACSGILPATSAASFGMTVQVGGTFQTSGYLATYNVIQASTQAGGTTSTTIRLLDSASSINPLSGTVRFSNPAANRTNFLTTGFGPATNGTDYRYSNGAGFYNANGAVTGLSFQMSSGNIVSGSCKIYGFN